MKEVIKGKVTNNMNMENLAEWVNEIFPNGMWTNGELCMMEFEHDREVFQVQLKVTRDENEFLDHPRVDLGTKQLDQ